MEDNKAAGVPVDKEKASNHLFSENYIYYGKFNAPTSVSLTRYNRERVEYIPIADYHIPFGPLMRSDSINWIQVNGLTDSVFIKNLMQEIGLHPLDMKAVMTPNHAAKVDDLTDRLIVVLKSCTLGKHDRVSSEHICIISKDNLVLTFRESGLRNFDSTYSKIEQNLMRVRNYGRAVLVAFILNSVFSETIGTALKVERMLENLDDVLLDNNQSAMNIGRQIQQCRHASMIIQKNSIPLHTEFRKLLRTELVSSDETMLLIYNELYNQLDYITLTSANSRELLSSMRDLYASNNELRTNAIMKRLTIVSTLFIPITFLVGLWGMNFRVMPETDWKYGYIAALAAICLTAYATWKFMKRNHWF